MRTGGDSPSKRSDAGQRYQDSLKAANAAPPLRAIPLTVRLPLEEWRAVEHFGNPMFVARRQD
jgi:hypothetical protein